MASSVFMIVGMDEYVSRDSLWDVQADDFLRSLVMNFN